jgi:hypothetical protein
MELKDQIIQEYLNPNLGIVCSDNNKESYPVWLPLWRKLGSRALCVGYACAECLNVCKHKLGLHTNPNYNACARSLFFSMLGLVEILNNEIFCNDKYMLYVNTLLQKLNRHFEPGEEQGVLNKSKQGEKSLAINTYLKKTGDFSPRSIFH